MGQFDRAVPGKCKLCKTAKAAFVGGSECTNCWEFWRRAPTVIRDSPKPKLEELLADIRNELATR